MTERQKSKRAPPLYLDMDFGEALERFAQVEPSDLPDNIKLKMKAGGAKPPAGKDSPKSEGARHDSAREPRRAKSRKAPG